MTSDWKAKLDSIKNRRDNPEFTDIKPIDSLTAQAPVDKVPASKESDKKPELECEACSNTQKTLHTFKNMKLCKTCYDKELNLPAIVPGDMGQPQTVTEQFVEADRRLVNSFDEKSKEVAEKIQESLPTEEILDSIIDRKRIISVFMSTMNEKCVGKTKAEIQEMLQDAHIMLYDLKAGIQAMLAYRAELAKDDSAEERAKALREDWLYKPIKAKTSSIPKGTASPKKEKKDSPLESMRKLLLLQGIPENVVEERLKKFQGIS